MNGENVMIVVAYGTKYGSFHSLIPELPLGGVGNSGMGKCLRRWGFGAFANARGVLDHSARIDLGARYPSYSKHMFDRKIETKLMPYPQELRTAITP